MPSKLALGSPRPWVIIDIFSSFDPLIYSSRSLFTYTPWITPIIFLILLRTSFWVTPSRSLLLIINFSEVIRTQSMRTNTIKIKPGIIIITSLFLTIFFLNIIGLSPYIFSPSRHLVFTITLALPLWVSLILSSISKNLYSTIAHLLPSGAPRWLNPPLTLIETTRILVRPITLSFRLAANIRTGHIILVLIRSYTKLFIFSSISTFIPLLCLQTIYVLFEIGIALIQAYVFCLLLTLYSDDHAL